MDVSVFFKPMEATASAGSIENGGRLQVHHGVNNISHVCWSDVKLMTKFKYKFVTDADISRRILWGQKDTAGKLYILDTFMY